MYLTSDFDAVKNRYKAFISLVPTQTSDSLAIREFSVKNGIPFLEITFDNKDITPSVLRDFCKNSGITVYSERDAVVYANESYVFIHTAEEGKQKLHIPSDFRLIDVFSNKEFRDEFYAKSGKSFLFEKYD